MKKQDISILLILFALMLAWPVIYKKIFPESPVRKEQGEVAKEFAAGPQKAEPSISTLETKPERKIVHPSIPPELAVTSPEEASAKPRKPEQRLCLTNVFVTATVSSWGGGIISAELYKYPETIEKDSGNVFLDFSAAPALTYSGMPGLSRANDFEVSTDESGSEIHIERTNAQGLWLTRTISLGENYRFNVCDTLSNQSSQPLSVPEYCIQLGPMRKVGTQTKVRGQLYLGVDVLLSAAGEGIVYWAKKIPKLFKSEMKERQLPRLPVTISKMKNTPIDWLAVKSKFFVQILAPNDGGAGYIFGAERSLLPGEGSDPDVNQKNAMIDCVSGAVIFSAVVLEPGQSVETEMSYYAGPKKLSILKHLGLHQEDVMNFGWWSPLCKILMRILNATYDIIPNYGIAIIILTILIRILFWPLTHKSTKSMKKMQELQPQMAELKKKHKDSPKKLQEETMALYKKNKVNPMSGCLPMIVQIPVFIALFVVLRSAIELRFAHFLWIKDLSEPERLLADVLPIPLNILPIFMALTMVWQQKLTPTTDPNQQKIMAMFMPIMMLVMFYMMPSALVLYWTASQCIMIAQQLIQKKNPSVSLQK